MKVRQAIVMVGGMGTRLRPLTENRPKPMLSVADRPCIWYLLRSLARAGVEEVILACGYKPGMMEALGDGSDLGIRIVYSYEDTPMGTAGSMKLAEDRLDDVFIAAYGDIFADIDVSEEVRIHFENKADITVALTAVEDPTQFGIARVDDTGRILEFKEKPKPEEVFSNLINAGIYVMNRSVLEKVPKDTFYDVSKELIPEVMAEGRIQAYQLNGVWMDVGRPHDLLEANLLVAEREYRLKRFDSAVECCTKGSFYLGEGAFIGNSKAKSTVISKGSKVEDSDLDRVLLLDDCEVSGATIVNSILGVGCRVGKGAKISNCVLADRTVVEEGSNLEGDRIV
ncbi:NDP-sugar synthase [Methanomassiliicoccales archaeon LGM-RCC1]|nr:NDP-sugar synthase [Methanomassiliicoccales archaeon LGM-RCC1]